MYFSSHYCDGDCPNTQIVGQSLTLQCEVTTVRGITSSVDIVWSSDGMVLQTTTNLTAAIMNDRVVFSNSNFLSYLVISFRVIFHH